MNATVITSKDHIDPKSEDGFIIYKIGYIHPPNNGARRASMLWGNTPGGELSEAPKDAKPYGRKDGQWAEVAEKDHDHEIGNQVLIFENLLI